MERCTVRWLAAAFVASVGLSVITLACGAFDAATADPDVPTPDGAAADALLDATTGVIDGAAPPDGATIDAGACPKPLLRLPEDFSSDPLPAPWSPQKQTQNGTLTIGPESDVDGGSAGNALRAFVDVSGNAGAAAWAYATAELDVRPRWVDVAYRVLVPPSDFYAELGCDVALLDKAATNVTGASFHLVRYASGDFHLGWSARDGADGGRNDDDAPLGLKAVAPLRWYGVRLQIQVAPASGGASARANATMTITDTNTGLTKSAVSGDVGLVGAYDSLSLACGLVYVDQAAGITQVAVDDLAVTACPE